jgi:hypothetical protein
MPKSIQAGPPPILRQIHLIRGQKVMLDSDLASLYRVPTKVLNQAVRRNLDRFPVDFMFRLSMEETAALRSQIVTLEEGRGKYSKYAPRVFTEHGVAMLAGILRSDRAVTMSIEIIRAFVRLREMIAANKDLAARVEKLEQSQNRAASILRVLVDEIDNLKALPAQSTKRRIGFGM